MRPKAKQGPKSGRGRAYRPRSCTRTGEGSCRLPWWSLGVCAVRAARRDAGLGKWIWQRRREKKFKNQKKCHQQVANGGWARCRQPNSVSQYEAVTWKRLHTPPFAHLLAEMLMGLDDIGAAGSSPRFPFV